jgi:hypothetical protein
VTKKKSFYNIFNHFESFPIKIKALTLFFKLLQFLSLANHSCETQPVFASEAGAYHRRKPKKGVGYRPEKSWKDQML